MNSVKFEKLIVPSLSSEFEDASKNDSLTSHKLVSLQYLNDLKQQLAFESELEVSVCSTVKQTSHLIVLLLQYDSNSDWSTSEHVKTTNHILQTFFLKHQVDSLQKLLSIEESESTFWKIPILAFKFFQSKVGKDKLDCNPAACHACTKIVLNTCGRKVSSCFSMFLPFTLNNLDHYLPHYKLNGLHLLSHVLSNITSSELLFSGLSDVLYDVLHRLLYSNDPNVLEKLFPCMFLLLGKICRNPSYSEMFADWTKYDEVVTLILQHMRFESSARSQMAFIDAISTSVSVLNLAIGKHLRLLFKVLREYCDGSFVSSTEVILKSVLVLEKLIEVLNENIDEFSCEQILKCLFQLLLQHQNSTQIIDKCSRVLQLVSRWSQLGRDALRDLIADTETCTEVKVVVCQVV